MDKVWWFLQKPKTEITIMIGQSHFWVYTQKNWKWGYRRCLHTHVCSSIVHNSWKMKAAQMAIHENWMNRKWCVPTEEY